MRDVLVQSRTMMVNSVRAWSRTQLQAVRRGTLKTLPLRMREQAASCGEKLPDFVERLLVSIEQLTEQIKAATKELSALAGENEVCRRLMTVPGVGAITALRFVAAIDEIGRFSHAHLLESYLGLTPGEDSSSERRRITSITKAGPSQVRWTLVQASWAALRCAPNDPMCRWAKQVMLRRGKRIAIVALARKLAGILYAIWRDGSAYDPARNGSAR
jgi:transposase